MKDSEKGRGAASDFELFVVSPDGTWDEGLPIAASRAGAVGFLNLTYLADPSVAAPRIERLMRLARGRYGLVLRGRPGEVERSALGALRGAEAILLTCEDGDGLAEMARLCRGVARRVGLVATEESEARRAVELGLDFVAAKGNEAGGRVGEETAFVLLQRLLSRVAVPVYAWGGIGVHTSAACRAAGAAGAVLDWQLALAAESPIPAALRRRLAQLDGSETTIVVGPGGCRFRVFDPRDQSAAGELKAVAEDVATDRGSWERAIERLMASEDARCRLWPMGQDAAFASKWGPGELPAARILDRIRRGSEGGLDVPDDEDPLRPESPLARSHGTRFPVLQGPMTRVSDVPEFCRAVADGGGLPFLALALMRGPQAKDLLERTAREMGERSWGVGILGFVDRELRAEQVREIEAVRPPFAIIAGGRPDQAASLEAKGIATYLHVPSPGMLETFLREGARRFIFEGRECGGHVGPRSSFVLWETMIRVLTEAGLSDAEAATVHVAFAGGIHDALSAAMVAAMARPLVRRGMKVGVLLGTAYLFTEEAVSTGAILGGFQEVAVSCDRTALVESGPGHAIRCADTEFVRLFEGEKARLRREGKPAEEVREELEALNMGRLRVASKGVTRAADARPGQDPYVRVGEAEQRREGMYMIGQVAALRRGRCTIRQLHEDVCLGGSARIAALRSRATVPAVAAEPAPPPLEVAIVGMSCLLPGATDVDELWHNILAKRDLIGEVPPERFDASRYYDPDRKARDKVYSRWGGFLSDIPFDPIKYGIPPASLRSIEPGQLLALEVVDRVLKDAGYAGENPYRDRTSVVFGVSGGIADLGEKYIVRALLPQLIANPDESLWEQLPEWTEDSFAGLLANIVAGRVSNRFDFGGMNFTVDAACASSLAALMLACRTLADRTSDMVITGGCDTVQNQFAYLCFAKAGALSPRGRSRAFDASADGIAISEGLAAVALKRLEDAERDGDRIYAVIRGVAGGSDGRSKGMTAPRMEGQVRTLKRAYAQAGYSPATVGLFEAHGTGTAAGDATECQALTALLKEEGAPTKSVAVGSIKSMIGHTKSAAGIVGLVKAALALHHKVLPPTLHVESPNPKAGLVDGPLYVSSETRPWLRGDGPRRAAVSSFGFGGTNFHATLEEYEGQARAGRRATARRRWPAELFVVSGKSAAEVASRARGLAAELRKAVAAGAEVALSDLAYTMHRRSAPSESSARVAIVATGLDGLVSQLDGVAAALADGTGKAPMPEGVHYSREPLGRGTPPAYLFPGQGAQFPGMLGDLAVEFPEVAEAFERADASLAGSTPRRLSDHVFPPPAFSDAERARQAEELTATDVAQPALGACGVALARLLESFGVRPGAVGGHSYGELPALHVAGALDEASLYRLSRARGVAMLATAREGGSADLGTMIAALGDPEAVRKALGGLPDAWVANQNSPKQVVVSGTRPGIERAARALSEKGIATTPIPVACAFHSPLMEPARGRFEGAMREVAFRTPRMPVYSNVTAAPHDGDPDAIRGLLSRQITGEVRFVDEVRALYEAGARVFVELGPNRVLAKLVDQILDGRPHAAIALQARGHCGLTQLLHGLAELVAHGVAVDLERLYDGRSLRTIDLAASARDAGRKPAAHLWLVNGGEARPAAEPRRRPAPGARLVPVGSKPDREQLPALPVPVATRPRRDDDDQAATHRNNGIPAQRVITMTNISPTTDGTTAPDGHFASDPVQSHTQGRFDRAMPARSTVRTTTAATRPGQAGAEVAAYSEFQETMRQFLEIQRSVLEAYLLSGPSGPAEEVALFTEPRPRMTPPARRAAPAVAPRPEPTPPAAPNGHATNGHATNGHHTNGHATNGHHTNGHATNGHAAAPTAAVAPARPAPAPSPASVRHEPVEAPVPSAPDVGALEGMLLDVASERTGYPAEMLGLDANLEADLGIDSIKRVEIIGAFRRAALPAMAEPPAHFMEEMSAARTLRAILEGVARLAGLGPKPAVAEPKSDPTPAPTGSAPEAEVDLEGLLLQVASERTGYPAEMLGLDANLEADLGIDSIKRVEIIGAFRRAALPAMAEPPAHFMEEMSAARTLRAILEGVARLRGGGGPRPDPNSPPHDGRSEDTSDRPPRCVASVVEIGPAPTTPGSLPRGVMLLTDDGRLARVLAGEIAGRGGLAATLGLDDLATRDAAEAAVARIRAEHGPIGGVVHLLPTREVPAFPGIDRATWDRSVDQELKGLLFVIQAIAPELDAAKEGDRVVSVTAVSLGGGDFGERGELEASRPWRGGLAGMLKTAAKEWPGARFRAVDFDALPDPASILAEALAEGPVEVGYRRGRRLGLRVVREELPDEPTGLPAVALSAESVVLITGGAQGITAEIAREIAGRSRATLVLLGRTPAPEIEEDPETAGVEDLAELRKALIRGAGRAGRAVTPKVIETELRSLIRSREVRRTLGDLRAAGSRAEYLACDVRDERSLTATVADVTRRLGGVDVLIHGAGVIEDRRVMDKTADSFDRVFGTKLDPMLTLARVLDPSRLKLVMVFSSVAGYFGNEGQVDYAAANETLNRMARRMGSLGPVKAVAMNWGPWSGSGMVTPEVARQFADRGIGLVTVPGGRGAAWRELLRGPGGDVRAILGPGSWVEEADGPVAPARADGSLPLLAGRSVLHVSDGVATVRLGLDADRIDLLRDHKIDGKPVMPLTMALELMAEAAALSQPALHVTDVANLRLYNGIVFDAPAREVEIRVEPIEVGPDGGEWRARIADPRQPARPLYEAMIRMSASMPAPPAAPELTPVGGRFPLSPEEAYDRWLFHGPAFHRIVAFRGTDEGGVDATLRPIPGGPRWIIDPTVLDTIPQLALLWSRATEGTSALPNRIRAYRRFGEIGSEPLEVAFRVEPETDRHIVRATAWLLRDGRVIGVVEGLEAARSAALNRIGGARG